MSDASFGLASVVDNAWFSECYSLEEVYFFTTLVGQFIPLTLYETNQDKCKKQTQQLYQMLLLAFFRWFDSALQSLIYRITWTINAHAPSLLLNKLAVYGLLMQ